MEKGNGGEKKVAAEKASGGEKKVEAEKATGGEKKVEAEKESGGGEKNPSAPAACFKKTAAEDATLIDTTKDYFKQLQVTSADTHWACIKNRARLAKEYVAEKTSSVFGKKKVEPEVKDDGAPAVAAEAGAKPAAAPVAGGGKSH